MAICRPAGRYSATSHNNQGVSIDERQCLIGEPGNDRVYFGELMPAEVFDRNARKVVNEVQKLNRPALIVPAQEPPMPFSDYQGGSDQRWWS